MLGSNNISNRETLKGLLENELKRSLRYQTFTSILLFEAHSRDSAGGDEHHLDVAERMATLIRKETRETDMIGKQGENIVIVVLLHSDKNVAYKVGHRLNAWLSNYLSSSGKISHTLSVGGACFPSHATDSNSLYQRAFEMLERAKGQSGNNVQILE